METGNRSRPTGKTCRPTGKTCRVLATLRERHTAIEHVDNRLPYIELGERVLIKIGPPCAKLKYGINGDEAS